MLKMMCDFASIYRKMSSYERCMLISGIQQINLLRFKSVGFFLKSSRKVLMTC
ncbi:hypothetical protein Hanom_Chr09g00845011 [Helianthus anomalus]